MPSFPHDSVATRARLVRAGEELYSTLGFHRTTTPMLAERAGVAEGTIYRLFKGKEQLLDEVCRQSYDWAIGLLVDLESDRVRRGTVVLQESGVAMAFVQDVLPRLDKEGIDLDIFYVASAELFDALPAEQRELIYPEWRAREAMGITGFTMPTMDRWVTSHQGRAATLHPFRKGHFLGSGQADAVLKEAGLDGQGQYEAIRGYLEQRVRAS